MTPRVLIIIPAFNEAGSIATIIERLRKAIPGYHLLVVNDGSTDETAEIVAGLGENQLRLPFNLGYGLALQSGLKYALLEGYEIMVCMDADGQHRPEDIAGLVAALDEQRADMVIGSRYFEDHSYRAPIDRRIGQLVFSILTRPLIGRRIYDTTSGFKAIRATACRAIIDSAFMDFHIESIVRLSLLGFNVVEQPVIIEERVSGKSMHSLSSIIRYPLKTILLTIVATADALLARRTK